MNPNQMRAFRDELIGLLKTAYSPEDGGPVAAVARGAPPAPQKPKQWGDGMTLTERISRNTENPAWKASASGRAEMTMSPLDFVGPGALRGATGGVAKMLRGGAAVEGRALGAEGVALAARPGAPAKSAFGPRPSGPGTPLEAPTVARWKPEPPVTDLSKVDLSKGFYRGRGPGVGYVDEYGRRMVQSASRATPDLRALTGMPRKTLAQGVKNVQRASLVAGGSSVANDLRDGKSVGVALGNTADKLITALGATPAGIAANKRQFTPDTSSVHTRQ